MDPKIIGIQKIPSLHVTKTIPSNKVVSKSRIDTGMNNRTTTSSKA